MKKMTAILIVLSTFHIPLSTVVHCAPVFPTSGVDVQSLARGGTSVATPGGVSSVLGNPATLVPTGRFQIGAQYLRDSDNGENSWVVGVADSSSSLRGAAIYLNSPEFAGFKEELWGVAFAQSLGSTITIGESFHYGDYENTVTMETDSLSGADFGLLLNLKDVLAIGYVSRNLYRSDENLLNRTNAYGLGLALPLDIYLTVDYEENPALPAETDLRTGAQFPIWGPLAGSVGYQDLAGGLSVGTTGISWNDANGSVELAMSYDLDESKMLRFMWGFNINY